MSSSDIKTLKEIIKSKYLLDRRGSVLLSTRLTYITGSVIKNEVKNIQLYKEQKR